MDFMHVNEQKTNLLVVKVLWAIFFTGYLLLFLLNVIGMAETAPSDFLMAMAGTFTFFGLGAVIRKIYVDKNFVKYVLLICSLIGTFTITYFIQRGVYMSPIWFLVIGISVLYFQVHLTILAATAAFFLNLYLIVFTPPPGLEEISLVNMIGNPLTFYIGAFAMVFISHQGKRFVNVIMNAEKESNSIKGNMQNILESSQKAAENSFSVSENMHRAANSLSSSIEDIAATANQFAANIQELSQKSAEMADSSRQVTDKASQGRGDVESALKQIDNIKTVIEVVNKSVARLVEKTREIGTIVTTINSIANQTNLLSMNAAIEAARAGAHGKGFAVVADEVHKLSEKASHSVQEVTDIVEENEEEAEVTISEIKRAVMQITESAAIIQNTGNNFRDVIGNVENLSRNIQDLASMGQELEAGSESLAVATDEQSDSVQNLTGMAGDLKDTSQNLLENLQYS